MLRHYFTSHRRKTETVQQSDSFDAAPGPSSVVVDEAMAQITDWGKWFFDGHLQCLRERGVDEATFAVERAQLEALTAAVTERMRADYAARARG